MQKNNCVFFTFTSNFGIFAFEILKLDVYMDKQFLEFIGNITLTTKQTEDAKTKYTGVCEKLHSFYYGGNYDACKKFLFGSYKTKTNVRPLTSRQDVDVLFKIPQETFDKYDAYESNGQAALLQEVKDVLKEKYTTTDGIKAWGKVVLVEFSEGHHNVELLPALEQEDGTFLIPNSENGGSWETFDPRKELDNFKESNDATDNLTRELAKMLKAWDHNTATMNYKSCDRMDDIIAFLNDFYPTGKGETSYSKIVFDFFDYMKNNPNLDESLKSYINTAQNRAQKAIEYENDENPKDASEEWIKILGSEFPKVNENPKRESTPKAIITPARPWSN